MPTRITKKVNLDKIKKIIKQNHFTTKVGWFSDKTYEDGVHIAQVAAVQEYGSPAQHIPPRPFMRPVTKNIKHLLRFIPYYIKTGKSKDIPNTIGVILQSKVQESISSVYRPKLSPVTIAARAYKDINGQFSINDTILRNISSAIREGKTGKGELGDQTYPNTKPLRDTGLLLASVSYMVSYNG